jgi:glycerol uptake facilitator-like aquaporin
MAHGLSNQFKKINNMKNIISNFLATMALFHLVFGLYLLFTEPNQMIFFTVFFIGLFYTSIFLYMDKTNNLKNS